MKETPVNVSEDQRGTAARSEVYRALSALFRYPCNTTADTLQTLAAVLRDKLPELSLAEPAAAQLSLLLEEIERLALAPALPPLEAVYTALFDNCRGRSAVSLYEKDYGNGDAKTVWEELIRFYEHFGLNFDVRHSHDWPDHIGTQLEFMHYLTYLEATVPAAERSIYVRGQADFLGRRLARWSARFAAQVNGLADNAPYGLFARLVDAFVDAEMAALGLPRQALGHWVPLQSGASIDSRGRTIIPIVDPAAIIPAWEMEEPFV